MKVACVQLSSGEDYNKNFSDIVKFVNLAIKKKSDLIITPETSSIITNNKKLLFKKSFSMKKDPLIKISYNKNNYQIMEKSNNDDLLFTPENNNKRKTLYVKYSAIGLLIIILIGSIYFFSDNYLTNQKVKEIEIAQKKIKSNVQKATFDLGKLSKVELSLNSSEIDNSTNLSSNQKYFSIIAGSFRSINNAENKLNSLLKEGYKAEMAKKSSEGFHRVAYGRFSSKKKAINLLIFVKYTLQEDAWFLEE